MDINIEDLTHTHMILGKANYSKKKLKLESIIPWTKLFKIPSLANGSPLGSLSISMPWVSVLKLLIEIAMVAMNLDPTSYFDKSINYQNKKRKAPKARNLKYQNPENTQ